MRPDLDAPLPGTPSIAECREAWRAVAAAPLDDSALNVASAAADRLADALGHGIHGGWQHQASIGLVCECGETLYGPEGAAT